MSITNKNISQMEAGGVFDYWNRLTIFIREFIDRNYPLSKQDMKSIMDDNLTEDVIRRQRAMKAMQDKLHEIVAREFKANKHNIDQFTGKPDFRQVRETNTLDESLEAFKQEILEAHWNELCAKDLTQQEQEETVFGV